MIYFIYQLKEKDRLGQDVECLKGEINKMRDQIVPQKESNTQNENTDNNAAVRSFLHFLCFYNIFFLTKMHVFCSHIPLILLF